MANYCPNLVEDLTNRLNAMTGAGLTQNDVFRELEAMRERYAPLEPAPTPDTEVWIVTPPLPEGVTFKPAEGQSYRYEHKTPLPKFSFRPAAPTLTPDAALEALHTIRPADPTFTRSYLDDAS